VIAKLFSEDLHLILAYQGLFGLVMLVMYTVSQKVPTFNLSVTLSNLNRFSKQNLCTAEKRMTYATKLIRYYSSHLRHVATLPWESKNAIFADWEDKRKQTVFLIVSNFVIHPQILIFSVFKIAILSSY